MVGPGSAIKCDVRIVRVDEQHNTLPIDYIFSQDRASFSIININFTCTLASCTYLETKSARAICVTFIIPCISAEGMRKLLMQVCPVFCIFWRYPSQYIKSKVSPV